VLEALVVVVGSAVVALGLSWLTLRVTGPYFAMVTFALAEFAHLVVQDMSWTGGTNGLVGLPFPRWITAPGILYEICAVTVLLTVAVILVMRPRRWGLWIRAARDNPIRVEMLGMSHRRIKMLTLTAAGGLAALAGVFYVWYQGMAFTSVWDSNTSFMVLLMVVIGGVDTTWGPVMAGAGLYLMQSWISGLTSHWEMLLGILYLVVVRVLPQGLSGLRVGGQSPGSSLAMAAKSGGQTR
ncbi:MAG: branched-chain amino acid ABC transporter permease, partial [Sulfobacillus sp.]|nr:branched-chain amino acid ABC transporter permease [Sulfobacillus sp.]